MKEREIIIPIARGLRNERRDGLWSLLMPGQAENKHTTYLDAADMVIDTSQINNNDNMEKCPSIREMLSDWYGFKDR